jgi:ribonuclease P protein component
MIYSLEGEGAHPVSMAVSVPKRLFKRAVDRNLLKRRIREAYRQNKYSLYQLLHSDQKMHVLIQYHQKDIADFQTIEAGLQKGFEKLGNHLAK